MVTRWTSILLWDPKIAGSSPAGSVSFYRVTRATDPCAFGSPDSSHRFASHPKDVTGSENSWADSNNTMYFVIQSQVTLASSWGKTAWIDEINEMNEMSSLEPRSISSTHRIKFLCLGILGLYRWCKTRSLGRFSIPCHHSSPLQRWVA